MITSNINLGRGIRIDKEARINNIRIGDRTKIARGVKIFGSEKDILEVGIGCYIGPNCFIEGFNAKIKIGNYVSFAQNINIISGSGPNASQKLQKIFPIIRGEVLIDDHSWIGSNVMIMPNVHIGKYCVVAVNSFVSDSFPDYSVIGGTPAKLIRTLTPEEIEKLHSDN